MCSEGRNPHRSKVTSPRWHIWGRRAGSLRPTNCVFIILLVSSPHLSSSPPRRPPTARLLTGVLQGRGWAEPLPGATCPHQCLESTC